MDRAKHPEIAAEFDTLTATRDKILAELAPLEDQAAKLRAVANDAEAAWRKVREQIAATEKGQNLRGISLRRAALARAMGARGLQAGGAR